MKRTVAVLLILSLLVSICGFASAEAESIKISGTRKVFVGQSIQLTAVVRPADAGQKVKWKSSDPSVATVSSSGKVKGIAPGKVKITAVSTVNKKVKKSVTVTVTEAAPDTPKYYALLIGNGFGYPADIEVQLLDAPDILHAMKTMLKGLQEDWHVTVKSDLTAGGILSAIHSAFQNAKENDVCLFFYSGHGISDESAPAVYDAEQGGLIGVDLNTVSGARLAAALKEACPGKVIVILDSCGSGSLVYKKKGIDFDPAADARRFMAQMKSSLTWADNVRQKTGELRNSRFMVLTACAYMELGTIDQIEENVRASLFAYYLVQAAGCGYPDGKYSGQMPADINGDGALTLNELYRWVFRKVSDAADGYQNVQKYGDGSTVLFCRRK